MESTNYSAARLTPNERAAAGAISHLDVALLLGKLAAGNHQAEAELIPFVCIEPRRIAGYCVRDEGASHTLQPAAILRLKEFDPQQERIVEMRCYGGLAAEETAEALGISPRTEERGWTMAKGWLRAKLAGGRPR